MVTKFSSVRNNGAKNNSPRYIPPAINSPVDKFFFDFRNMSALTMRIIGAKRMAKTMI